MQLSIRGSGIRDMTRKRLSPSIAVLIFSLMIVISGCSSSPQERSADRLPRGWTEASLLHDGLTRWYRIYLPDPMPQEASLVLYLHGGTLSMRSLFSPLADSTQTWFEIAREGGVILVVPNGTNPENGDTYGDDQVWNDLRPDQAGGQSQVDDVGFLLTLLDAVSAEYPVDQDRVYVTGASNGGMMTYRMLLEAPERFAAGAVYIANLPAFDDPLPDPAQPVPIMIANGTEDPLMPYEGGVVAKNRGVVISTRETVEWWIEANRADREGILTVDLPDLNPEDGCRIREEIYPAGVDGAEVRLYIMEGGGHTLPSLARQGLFQRLASRLLGPVCQDADGVRLVWDFFSEVSSQSSP